MASVQNLKPRFSSITLVHSGFLKHPGSRCLPEPSKGVFWSLQKVSSRAFYRCLLESLQGLLGPSTGSYEAFLRLRNNKSQQLPSLPVQGQSGKRMSSLPVLRTPIKVPPEPLKGSCRRNNQGCSPAKHASARSKWPNRNTKPVQTGWRSFPANYHSSVRRYSGPGFPTWGVLPS